MFLLLGGALSFIVGLVGVLNFFNAVLTGIITRKREFAVLQSIGMTGRQRQTMLVYEGLFYALARGTAVARADSRTGASDRYGDEQYVLVFHISVYGASDFAAASGVPAAWNPAAACSISLGCKVYRCGTSARSGKLTGN